MKQYSDGDDTMVSLAEHETKSALAYLDFEASLSKLQGTAIGYSDPRLLKSAYFSQDWLYIIIDRVAMYLSQIPWQVHKEVVKDGEKTSEPAMNHPFQRSLDFPNPLQSAYHFKYSVVTDLCVTGNAFVFDSKSNGWLVQFPTEISMPRVDGSGNLTAYEIVGFDPMNFPVGDRSVLDARKVIHIKRPNPSSVYWGLSPLLPGADALEFINYSQDYLINYFKKGAQPGYVLQFTEEANEAQARNLLASIESANAGRSNQRRGMLLPKGVEMVPFQAALAETNLLDYMDSKREAIINLFGIPKQELSIAESSSLGSDEYKIAIANMWRGPLTSIAGLIESAMTNHFQSRLGKGYVIKLNMSAVPALQEDLKQKAETGKAMLDTMTMNEVRAKVWKLPPVEGGDEIISLRPAVSPFGAFPGVSPAASSEPKPLNAPASADETKPLNAPTGDSPEPKDPPQQDGEIQALTARANRVLEYRKSAEGQWLTEFQERQEREAQKAMDPMARIFLKMLSRQIGKAIEIARKHLTKTKAEVPQRSALMDEIENALDENKKAWVQDYNNVLTAQVNLGYDSILSIPFNKPYQDEIEAIKAQGIRQRRALLEARGIETFENLNKTTTEQVMRAIQYGVENSQTLQEIGRAIADISDVSDSRAFTIARTEVLTASSIGQAAALEDAQTVIPNMVKIWINAQDDRVRGNPNGIYKNAEFDHWHLEGKVVGADEYFPNGLRYPRDTKGEPGNTINCRCSFLTASEDDLERLGFSR